MPTPKGSHTHQKRYGQGCDYRSGLTWPSSQLRCRLAARAGSSGAPRDHQRPPSMPEPCPEPRLTGDLNKKSGRA